MHPDIMINLCLLFSGKRTRYSSTALENRQPLRTKFLPGDGIDAFKLSKSSFFNCSLILANGYLSPAVPLQIFYVQVPKVQEILLDVASADD